VYSTYGDDVGVSYAESIKNFSRNCEYASFIVDHLLDILTGNEHKKTTKYIEEQKMIRQVALVVFCSVAEQRIFLSDRGSSCDPAPAPVVSHNFYNEQNLMLFIRVILCYGTRYNPQFFLTSSVADSNDF
jgi:Domain of unknown function (DUF3512)